MAQIQKTQKMKLQVGDGGSPEIFASIGGMTNWSDSGVQVGENESTDLDSDSKEYYATLPDEGDFSFDLNLISGSAEHQQLLNDLRAGTIRNYRLLKNDGITATKAFPAFVKSFSRTGAADSHITASVSLRISSTPTEDII